MVLFCPCPQIKRKKQLPNILFATVIYMIIDLHLSISKNYNE